MKIRSDSLYARLDGKELLDEFFGWVAAEAPGYRGRCRTGLPLSGSRPAPGAINNPDHLSYGGVAHPPGSGKAADEAVMDLPHDADAN